MQAIDERYRIERTVGQGGFGSVLMATDKETGAKVAIKRLHDLSSDPVAAERFDRECRLLARITHPNLVRFVAHGKDTSDRLCLVLEWLPGEDVRMRQKREPLTIADVVGIGRQTALGLAALHEAGIVHRDIKPSNLLLVSGDDLTVKLIDLGAARTDDETSLTIEGTRIGTPSYMSPEQAKGERDIGFASDIFSLGVVIYQLVSGHKPFHAQDDFVTLAKIVLDQPQPLRSGAPELDAIVDRAMEKSPHRRFGSAREMADALARVPPIMSRAPSAGEERSTVHLASFAVSPTSERRVVTALFASFEDQSVSVGDAFASIVVKNGGVAHRLLGGQMIGLFGGGVSHGDEAIAAARSAHEVRDLAPAKLAITTGQAQSEDTGLSGEAIERGATLLHNAGTRIVVDDATARMLPEHVDSLARGERVLRRTAGATRPRTKLLGVVTPTVGRDPEIALLTSVVSECIEERSAKACLVSGNAGLGKSRLAHEVIERSNATVVVGRGDPMSGDSAFATIATLVRSAAGIADGEPPAKRAKKIRARISIADPTPFIEVVGASSARHGDPFRDVLRLAMLEWLESERAPVVFVIEDVHWADAPSLKLLSSLVRTLRDRPIFVLLLGRPEAHEKLASSWDAPFTNIGLGPLSRNASAKLARLVLGEAAPDALEAILDRAEGNAFFIEELIRALSERRALPATVLGMMQARLDALGARAKQVLRAASVFGREFPVDGVVELMGGATAEASVGEALHELVSKEVVDVQRGALYAFRHALLRDAAYAMLTESDRMHGHAIAGAFLERRADSDPAVLAHHFEAGGEPSRAVVWFRVAAEKAMDAGDLTAAFDRAKRARECGADGPTLGALSLIEAKAFRWRGELERASEASLAAAEMLQPGSAEWFEALTEVCDSYARLGHEDFVRDWIQKGRETASEDMSVKIACLCRGAAQLVQFGDYSAADGLFDDVMRMREKGTLTNATLARVEQARGLRELHRGRLADYIRAKRLAAKHFDAAGDSPAACIERANTAYGLAEIGAFEAAEKQAKESLAIAERMAMHHVVAFINFVFAGIRNGQGDVERARTYGEDFQRSAKAHGDVRFEARALALLSAIELQGKNAQAALDRADASVAIASRDCIAHALAARARALFALDRREDALVHAREGLRLLEERGGIVEGESIVRLAIAEASNGDEACRLARVARDRILERANGFGDEAWKDAFLERPEHVRTLALARDCE